MWIFLKGGQLKAAHNLQASKMSSGQYAAPVSCGQDQGDADGVLRWLQDEVLRRTESLWPRSYKHGYWHYKGKFIEEQFFDHWREHRPALPHIYLPIGWSTYLWSARRVSHNATAASESRRQVRLANSLTIMHHNRLCATNTCPFQCVLGPATNGNQDDAERKLPTIFKPPRVQLCHTRLRTHGWHQSHCTHTVSACVQRDAAAQCQAAASTLAHRVHDAAGASQVAKGA